MIVRFYLFFLHSGSKRSLANSPFAFLPFLRMSPSEAHVLYESPTLRKCLLALEGERVQNMDNEFFT